MSLYLQNLHFVLPRLSCLFAKGEKTAELVFFNQWNSLIDIKKLMPLELKQYIFSGSINPNNKDTLIHLAECMLINLDELENLNRTEIGSLKELITKNHNPHSEGLRPQQRKHSTPCQLRWQREHCTVPKGHHGFASLCLL